MNDSLARKLWDARVAGSAIDVGPAERPATAEAAYALQAAIDAIADAARIGFKVGATAQAAMKGLALDAPFYGSVFERYAYPGGGEVPIPTAHQPRIETEFVVGLGADLPPRTSEYDRDEVAAAVAWVAPGFEIVGTRVRMDFAGAGPMLVADGGANVGYVAGVPVEDWRRFDLAAHPVSLAINGTQVASGHAGVSLWGHALGPLAWLASQPGLAPRGLLAGDLVMTGTCTGILPISPGDEAHADFGALGALRARFVAA